MARIYDKSDVSVRAMKQVAELLSENGLEDFGLVNLDKLNLKMMEKIKDDNPKYIVGYGFLPQTNWVNDGMLDEFLLWIITGRALFVRQPVKVIDLMISCQRMLDGELDNRKMIVEVYLKKNSSLINVLLHDLYPSKMAETKQKAVKRAKVELGIEGTEDDVRNKLNEMKNNFFDVKIDNKVTTGVHCDVEGTLLLGEKINFEVVDIITGYEEQGKKVTIWTGGDVKFYKEKLRELKINRDVVSKYHYVGKKVEIVIDDLDREEFVRIYGILPEKYIKI